MIALSTSFISRGIRDGEGAIRYLEDFEIDGIELDYRIDGATCRQIREALAKSRLKVASVHNYFPIPWVVSGSGGGGDLFSLCSPDAGERRRAVYWTTETMRHAADFGASTVVLHCGYTQMEHEWKKIIQFFRAGTINRKAAREFIQEKLRERDELNQRHLSSLLLSLGELVKEAESEGIGLGIENRYYYYELPTFDNFRTILEVFEGSPIGYWHDTGHAHANEVLGIIGRGELLEAYGGRLLGIHVHDARGLEDHLVPGAGEIDFRVLGNFMKRPEIPVVVEPRSGTPERDVTKGIKLVKEVADRE